MAAWHCVGGSPTDAVHKPSAACCDVCAWLLMILVPVSGRGTVPLLIHKTPLACFRNVLVCVPGLLNTSPLSFPFYSAFPCRAEGLPGHPLHPARRRQATPHEVLSDGSSSSGSSDGGCCGCSGSSSGGVPARGVLLPGCQPCKLGCHLTPLQASVACRLARVGWQLCYGTVWRSLGCSRQGSYVL